VQSQVASAQQLPAGAFYRELLDTANPDASAQAGPDSPRTGTAAPTAPALQHGSTHADDAHSSGAEQALGLQMADGGAATASVPADADATAGLGSIQRIEIRQPVGRGEPAEYSGAAGTAFVGPSLNYGIPESNTGFQLLRKAGWQPGAGLGAESQGRRMPLEQSQQKGRQGLGAPTPKAAPTQQQTQQSRQDKQQVDAKQVSWPS
jgi:G-patch domain